METFGVVMAATAGAAIFVVGCLYLLVPRVMAASFGLTSLPEEPAIPWLRVKGVRDLVAGVVAAVLLFTADPLVLAWCVLAFTLIPIGDAVLVLSSKGRKVAAWGIHGSTAALMLISVLLILGSGWQ